MVPVHAGDCGAAGDLVLNLVDGQTPLDGIVQMETSGSRSCAVLEDTTVRCWGQAPSGDGTNHRRRPVVVKNPAGVAALQNVTDISSSAFSHGRCWSRLVGPAGSGAAR